MKLLSSKRLWVALALSIGLFLLRINPFLITVLIFGIAFLFNSKTLRPLRNYKFWIVILFLVVLVPIFTGIQDKSFIGINYSSNQLQKTLLMTLRGISVFILFQVLTIDLNIDNIKPIFSRLGIKNFDVLFNLSNEIFPKIKSILSARYSLFKANWKKHKSAETLLSFFTEIFSDFFNLSESLSNSDTKDTVLSPAELIINNNFNNVPYLIIIVGDAGTGKTHWIKTLINLLQSKNEKIDGLFSEKIIDSNELWHHDLMRVATKEKNQLTSMEPIESDMKVGKFYFYETSINWGNEQLKSIQNTNWIIIDEVGLLEFDGAGLLPGLQSVTQNFEGCLVITLRSALYQHHTNFIEEYLPSIKDWEKMIVEL